jgi:AcrR family transcriptional regulator
VSDVRTHASSSLTGRLLPPEAVAADQRRRILAAVPEAVAAHGFDRTFVRHIVEQARISRPTFYELFDDRFAAFRAAYEHAFDCLLARLEWACEAQRRWPQKVSAAVSAALVFSAAEPAAARLIAVGPLATGATTTALRNRSLERLIPPLRAGRKKFPEAASLPSHTEQALLGGICSVIAERLHAGEQDSLPTLAPQLTQLTLTPYLGATEARRIACA